MIAKALKEKRLVRQWLRKNKTRQCPVCHGLPMSSLTVVPKAVLYGI